MSDSRKIIEPSKLLHQSAEAPAIEHDQQEHLGQELKTVPLLPLKNVVMLPKSIIPIIVGRDISIEAVERALQADKEIFITTQKNSSQENPTLDDVYHVGTQATILQVVRMPNGALKILAEGICRAKAIAAESRNGCLMALVKNLDTDFGNAVEIKAAWRQLAQVYSIYAQLNDKAPAELLLNVSTNEETHDAVDSIAVHVQLSATERQEILEKINLFERIITLCSLLERETEILKTEQRIRGRIQSQVEQNQKEFYLNEQIKAIHKELGRDDLAAEIADLRSKIDSLGLSTEAELRAERELSRLEQMSPLSPEASVSRSYLDWLANIPWKRTNKDRVSLVQAERLLENSHAGLKKPKERVLEFIAAKKFTKDLKKSPIICLVGPPGVGKTSLASSIAKSLGRPFVRISLGGVKDESEIRGHRRTYIGALPGKVIHAMRKSKVINPVILFDEVDKMSSDFAGDPASALLEVLDPEQNKAFVDHYLDVEYDLSQVMFIATANSYDAIPYPLLDRMEIIGLSGYTDAEKVIIARQFLIPKNLKAYGLMARQCKIPNDSLLTIVCDYTKEAGVRQLDRAIAKLCRKTIQVLLQDYAPASVSVTKKRLIEWLGNQKYRKTSLTKEEQHIGLATGLAWTELGGDVLEIETTILQGKGNVTLTGQLGEVMQESAQAALSFIRSRSDQLKLPRNFHTNKDIHIHIPEGATPKDGPSAGITICTALISALTGTQVRKDVAMTGEITLRGRVLAIGGLKEKLLAAKQHNMKLVLIPEENKDDLEEILKETELGELKTETVSSMDAVIKHVFLKSPRKQLRSKA